ncbi:MAG: hypothetical protein IJ324_05235 [Lachnospiraceae bacterium]|nr:hypothetical protein [Lachnospiraceae bacterium]
MGTFGGYYGNCHIDDEKKEVFNEQMAKILNYGGMMDHEEVKIYGQEICLLNPFALREKGYINFYYNYFEDNSWETASYEPEKTSLWTEKIGYAEFADVVMAAYFLYEVYDSNPGFVVINADTINYTEYVGWLNHLLGTEFSMKKRFRLWENAEWEASNRLKLIDEEGQKEEKNSDFSNKFIPRKLEYLSGGIELADLLYIFHGTESLVEGHKELVEEIGNEEKADDCRFLEEFFQIIKDADAYYKRIFPFRDMFYEFLQNSHKVEYVAAIKLLREIVDAEENRKCGELIKHIRNGGWDMTDKRITQNKGRMRVKRYLAVMANKELRRKVFMF